MQISENPNDTSTIKRTTLARSIARLVPRRWRDARTTPPIVKGGFVNDQFASPNNPDVAWLQERATRPVK